MIIDEYELYALACDADKRDIPEAAAAVFRTLLRRHPESPLAGAATFYLQNGFQLPSAIDSESRARPAPTQGERRED